MVRFAYGMSTSDGLGYPVSEVGNLRCHHRESGSWWLAYILTIGDLLAASIDQDHAMVIAN